MTKEVLKTITKLFFGKGVQKSYSQDGEDVLVASLLRKQTGTYVDVGAYHPVLYSNTYALYKKGWKGVVIDSNATFQPLYKIFRPRDIFVHSGVASKAATRDYFMFSDGAYNTFVPEEVEARKQNPYLTLLGTKQIALRPLCDILNDAKITSIDFLSIDIEGMDVEALESLDWNYPPRVIAIEDNSFESAHPEKSAAFQFLAKKGYYLAAFTSRTPIFVLHPEDREETGKVV